METVKAARLLRDVVTVRGADAREHLQSQLSQDVMALEPGDSAWSFLLGPKGRVIALLRVTHGDDGAFMLDTDPGWGDAIRDAIDGFLFRLDVAFESATWDHLAFRGRGSRSVVIGAPIVAPVQWGDIEGLDAIAPSLDVPGDVESASFRAYDSLRIWAGWPTMGAEIDPTTTPAMTGLVGEAVSFTKGCYPGQELVARMHYRNAAPPRRLVRVKFHPCAEIEQNTELLDGDDVVGRITSVAECQPFALAVLDRAIDTPAPLTCGGCPATAEAVPQRASRTPDARKPVTELESR